MNTTLTTTLTTTLAWWRASEAEAAPEVVVMCDDGRTVRARRALDLLGVWAPRADFDANGEWLGTVKYAVPDAPRLLSSDEPPPPPPEIVVPVYADPTPTLCALSEIGVPESEGSEDKGDADNGDEGTKRRGPPATVCPPEVEALLGTDKDTLIAAQTGFSVSTISAWRAERGIPRYYTKSAKTADPTPEAAPEATVTTEAEAAPAVDPALASLVTHRFPEGASDEDMATEAGVSVIKIVDTRRKLGLQRPRGRKPKAAFVPAESLNPAEDICAQDVLASTPEVTPEALPAQHTDAELDALLG